MPATAESPCTSIAEAEIWDWIDSVFQDHHEKNAASLAAPHTQDAALFGSLPVVHEHTPVLVSVNGNLAMACDFAL
jgi:hypothetical protein